MAWTRKEVIRMIRDATAGITIRKGNGSRQGGGRFEFERERDMEDYLPRPTTTYLNGERRWEF